MTLADRFRSWPVRRQLTERGLENGGWATIVTARNPSRHGSW